MAIESALIKPVVDAIMALLRRGENVQLHRNAEKAVREAIRELLLATPDENKAAARIAIAKAAGLLSEDVVLAEDMLQKHRETKGRTRARTGSSRTRSTRKASAEVASKPASTPASKPTSGKATKTASKAPSKTTPKPANTRKSPARKPKPKA